MMDTELQLQILSIVIAVFVGVVGVLLPVLIAVVGFVYIRRFEERITNVSNQVDELWDRVSELEDVVRKRDTN